MTTELNWNDMREIQMKREMDALQDRTTGNMVAEKIASRCKQDIAEHGKDRHIKRIWEDFITQS